MSAESAEEILFKSMVVGCPHDLVEVYRTLHLSGPRDAVLRTLGQSAVLCGIRDLGPLRLEGRMAPIRLLSPNQETEMELDPELDPERVAKALIATIHLDHRLVAALRRELDRMPHPGKPDATNDNPETPSSAPDPSSQGSRSAPYWWRGRW